MDMNSMRIMDIIEHIPYNSNKIKLYRIQIVP